MSGLSDLFRKSISVKARIQKQFFNDLATGTFYFIKILWFKAFWREPKFLCETENIFPWPLHEEHFWLEFNLNFLTMLLLWPFEKAMILKRFSFCPTKGIQNTKEAVVPAEAFAWIFNFRFTVAIKFLNELYSNLLLKTRGLTKNYRSFLNDGDSQYTLTLVFLFRFSWNFLWWTLNILGPLNCIRDVQIKNK